MARLSHRGPDDHGVHRVGNAVLGHRRLSVIDPSGGHQPLVAPDGSALVANGMVYNDLALRGQLADQPYASQTDAESILHLVRRDGPTRSPASTGCSPS